MSAPIAPTIPDTVTLPDPLLTAKEVAIILGVRPKRVYELGIPAIRISPRTLRWRRSDVEEWIENRRSS